jgi:hypothetical protein
MSYLEMLKGAESAISVKSPPWTEGDDLIDRAFVWIADRYARLSPPRPDVIGPGWQAHEARIEAAYTTGDAEQLKTALRAYCQFAMERFGRAQANVV